MRSSNSNSNSNSNRASSSSSSAAENEMASSCRRSASTKRAKIIMMPCRKLGKYLKQQQGRLYIIRRCVVMLICWRD